MDGNPYSAILKLLRSEQNVRRLGMRLGTVVSVKPLSVSVAGLELPASAFYVDERLLSGTERRVKVMPDTAEIPAHEALLTLAASGFAEGDRLLLLTEDDQAFYIMAKVVAAE